MTKKAYDAAPTVAVAEILPTVILAGSPKVTVDDGDALTYDDTPGDASGGKSRRHDVWEDQEEEEQY